MPINSLSRETRETRDFQGFPPCKNAQLFRDEVEKIYFKMLLYPSRIYFNIVDLGEPIPIFFRPTSLYCCNSMMSKNGYNIIKSL